MSEDYTYPPTPRMVRAEELDAMRARAEAAERERDAWQRNAAMWHDKAEAAEAALRVVDTYASYYYDARQCYECGGERQPLEFAEWSQRLQGLIDLLENTEVQP